MKVIQLHNNTTELISKASKNNRRAQHLLYEMHAPKMLSICRYYVKDLQKAEEVMLNGFFKAFSHLSSFKHEGSFEGWMRRIMVREAISYLRQQKNVEFLTDEIEINQGSYNDMNVEMEVSEIQQLIDDLPEGYKMVFVMYAIEGYKHQEIADILKITEGTSKSQLFKARKLLQQKINELNKTGYGTN